MVADEDVGTCLYQLVGLMALARNGLKGVLTAPMKRYNDDCGGVCLAQTEDTFQERVHRFLADARFVRQVGIVFKC